MDNLERFKNKNIICKEIVKFSLGNIFMRREGFFKMWRLRLDVLSLRVRVKELKIIGIYVLLREGMRLWVWREVMRENVFDWF